MTKLLRRALIAASTVLALLLLPILVVSRTSDGESQCYGSTSNGRLENGVRLRPGNAGMIDMDVRSYCGLCTLLLRTYVHSDVADVVADAYGDLRYGGYVSTVWVYGETG